MLGLDKIKDLIDALTSFNSKQLATLIFLIALCVAFAFWVENRYAKIREIDQQYQKSQQQLDSAYFLSLEMFSMLNDQQRKLILEKLELSRQNRNKLSN